MCSNVRSALLKMDEVRTTLLLKKIDVFACTETWFTDSMMDSSLMIDGYSCLREDRSDRRGGGVALWIKNDIPAIRENLNEISEIESILVRLMSCKILLFLLYIPPQVASSAYSRLINDHIIQSLDSALAKYLSYDVIFCGDLNRLNISDICSHFSLANIHGMATYGAAELDYILMSDELAESYSVTTCPPFDRSNVPHLSLLATPKTRKRRSHGVPRKVYDLRCSNLQKFVSMVQDMKWDFLDDDNLTIDDKCTSFHSHLENAAEETIPTTVVICSARDKPWITPLVKALINQRWYAFRTGNFTLYNHLKTKVRAEISRCKASWTKRMQAKDLWKTVNAHLGTKTNQPLMSLLSQYESVDCAVEDINRHLASYFQDNDEDLPDNEFCETQSWNVLVTPELIAKLIDLTPNHKASPDLPTILYKKVSSLICKPLSRLIQQSVRERTVPVLWKHASICPIPKTSSPSLRDLRPISLLRFPAKLLEKCVLASVRERILQHYDSTQFGFRPKSSTQCALVSLHDAMTRFLDDPNTSGAMIIAYDYSKAFDRLRTNLILKRLVACGFPSEFIVWARSYLCGRYQSTQVGTISSSRVKITSGVPQGSILGPYLYALTTSEFVKLEPITHIVRYADDTTLCGPIYKNATNSHIIREHENILKWSRDMCLDMNYQKCQCLRIPKVGECEAVTIDGVNAVQEIKILGVYFNTKGNWTTHTTNIIRSSSRKLYALRILKPFLSNNDLKNVYFMLVRSLLEYCAPVFVGLSSTDALRLERVQRRFHRLLCGPNCTDSCLPSLSCRRLALCMKFLQSCMCPDHILNPCLPPLSRTGRFILPYRATTRRANSFFPFITELYNVNVTR